MNSLESFICSLANNGIFGLKKCKKVQLLTESNDVHKVCEVSFAKITLDVGSSIEELFVVIKQQPPPSKFRQTQDMTRYFSTEIFMYKSVLPFLYGENTILFPKMFYSGPSKESENTLILDDLTRDSYVHSKEVLFLDYHHVIISLKKLAEFHAQSYIAKDRDHLQFHSLVENLTFSKFFTEDPVAAQCYILSVKKCLDLIINKEQKEINILKELKEAFKCVSNGAKIILKPEEPFAVICHGDFCRNNILYKYNKEMPIDAKLFDLQNCMYSTPAMDIAFLLYLNISSELRESCWDEFLLIYWKSLVEKIPNVSFSYEQFLEHFEKRALFALLPVSFFVNVILYGDVLREFQNLKEEERIEKIYNFGGPEGSKILLEITGHMLKRRYFHKFLELYNMLN